MPVFKDFVEANPSADFAEGASKFVMLDETGANAEGTVTALKAELATEYAPLALATAVTDPSTILFYDTFDRADTAAGVIGTPDSGASPAWVSDKFGIVSNGLQRNDGNTGGESATVNVGNPNVEVAVTQTLPDTASAGPRILLRYIDSSNYLEFRSLTGVINKVVAGSVTTLATGTVPAALELNTTTRWMITTFGAVITVRYSGITLVTHTLTGGDETTFGSATIVGVRDNSTTNARRTRWDNFVVRRLA